jgi:hypothetical protein
MTRLGIAITREFKNKRDPARNFAPDPCSILEPT